jgi:hypothetical protein
VVFHISPRGAHHFLFDPDEGLTREVPTREELLDHIFKNRFSPSQQAQCRKDAEARGLTYMDLMWEIAASHDATMADPVKREEWLKISEEMDRRRVMPFGSDPLLEQDGGA